MAIPKYDELFNPLLTSLHELGGSATVTEMENKAAEILNLTDKEISEIHRGNRTVLAYRLAWARNYLKRFGLIENSAIGVWSLTSKGNEVQVVDKQEVKRYVKKVDRSNSLNQVLETNQNVSSGDTLWKDDLLNILKSVTPQEFEKLCQRILRESGFIEVKVTGKSGDGGIDGTGTIRLGGFISFSVIFQCKRYQGSVSSEEIRKFKGTMVGRAEKGLFITTGVFTKDAKLEASRDGSPPIDLIDGELLVEKMKEIGLGVMVKTEEVVEADPKWFDSF